MRKPIIAPGAIVELVTEEQAEAAASVLFTLEAEIERREKQLAAHRAYLEQQRAQWMPLLADYRRRTPPLKDGSKTLKLGNANLSMRTVPGGLRIDDEKAVMEWARKHLPRALIPSFSESLDRELVRRHVDETGEVPAGAVIRDDEERFYLTPPKAPKARY